MYRALHAATLELVNSGVSVYPCYWKNKVPALPWAEYKHRLPTEGEINKWFCYGPRNIAAVAGPISDNMVILDFDNGVSVTQLANWCRERSLRTWTVKTMRGWHVHIRVKHTPSINYLSGGVEVICNGSALVPPSVHPSGGHYATLPLFGNKIAWVDTLDALGMGQADACPDPKKEGKREEDGELLGTQECNVNAPPSFPTPAFPSFLRVCGGRSPSAKDQERVNYDLRIRDLAQRKTIIAEIKRRISMPTLLAWFTTLIPANRTGMYYAVCPLHSDGHPSLMSNMDRCFCNSVRCQLNHWADVIDAYATITGTDLWQTLTVLGRKVEVI